MAPVPDANFWQVRLSPDGRWVAFVLQKNGGTGVELFVARASGSDPHTWTRVAPNHDTVDKPRWSRDGKTLYVVSRQRADVPFDVWRVPFDVGRGLVGEPSRVTQFSSPSEVISELGTTEMGIGPQSVVLTMETATGNIWMLDNVGR
jgi:hypothetical protein